MAPSQEEWEQNKRMIKEYYYNGTRKEMMRIMETEHNFVASSV
jgi:hypothetical protein